LNRLTILRLALAVADVVGHSAERHWWLLEWLFDRLRRVWLFY
jgi:hypothetical protein